MTTSLLLCAILRRSSCTTPRIRSACAQREKAIRSRVATDDGAKSSRIACAMGAGCSMSSAKPQREFMENTSDKRATEIAVFRFGLIAEVVHLAAGSTEIAAKLRQQAQKLHTVPHSNRSHVAVETMRHWLKCYRRGGFEGLKPRSRRDAGGTRRLQAGVADALCALKDDKPESYFPKCDGECSYS